MIRLLLLIVCLLCIDQVVAQQPVFVLSKNKLTDNSSAILSGQPGWRFQQGYDSSWANPDFDDTQWHTLNPESLSMKEADRNGLIEGCFRFTLTLDSSLTYEPIYLRIRHYASVRAFINGRELLDRDYASHLIPAFQAAFENSLPQSIDLDPARPNVIVLYIRDQKVNWLRKYTYMNQLNPLDVSIGNATPKAIWARAIQLYKITNSVNIAVLVLLALPFWLLVGQNPTEKQLFWIAVITTLLMLDRVINGFGKDVMTFLTFPGHRFLYEFVNTMWIAMIPIVVSQIILSKTTSVAKWIFLLAISLRCGLSYFSAVPFVGTATFYISVLLSFSIIGYILLLVWTNRSRLAQAQWAAVIGLLLTFVSGFISVLINPTLNSPFLFYISVVTFLTFPASLLIYISLRIKENITNLQKNALKITQLSEEKQQILAAQNELLEQQVEQRTAELKASQNQLIQKEKLASLGELTAGIAHEIQNPLNFVNNFSEVSEELVEEVKQEREVGSEKRDENLINELLDDLTQNLQKINHHGKRAASIVSGMLEHSRTSTGERVPTDINKLAGEYLRLAYHGMRAKDRNFNSDYELISDPNLPQINVVPQEIGRVLLNLYNNAFYAVHQRHLQDPNHTPTVLVSTKQLDNQIIIKVKDNGMGMSESVKAKIFQPFFTTKPTGEGTGLGLSLSYDIITKGHGGTLEVESVEGEGAEFIIHLPIKTN